MTTLFHISNKKIKSFKQGWFEYFEANMKDLVARLNNGEALSDKDKEDLKQNLNNYKTNFFE